jgi:hypothetical protein
LEEIVAAPVKKTETNDRGIRCADTQHPISAKVGTTSPTSGDRSAGIVRLRTKATEFSLILLYIFLWDYRQHLARIIIVFGQVTTLNKMMDIYVY